MGLVVGICLYNRLS